MEKHIKNGQLSVAPAESRATDLFTIVSVCLLVCLFVDSYFTR